MVDHARGEREITRARERLILLVLGAAAGLFGAVPSLTLPALPQIQGEYSASHAAATWVLTAYLLAASVATPVVGRIGDAVGRKRMLLFSIGSLSVGLAGAALAPTFGCLLGARVVQGLGGGMLPLIFALIRERIPDERRAAALAMASGLTGAGGGVGLVLAGPLVSAGGTAALFWAPFAVSVITWIGARLAVPESETRMPGGVPVAPAVTFAVWMSTLLIAVSQGPSWGWSSPPIVAATLMTCAGVVAWIRLERRVAVPFVDLRLVTGRPLLAVHVAAFFAGVVMFASFAFVPLYLQSPFGSGGPDGWDLVTTGLIMLPATMMMMMVGLTSARAARRWGLKLLMTSGFLIAAGGMGVLVLHGRPVSAVMGANILIGTGVGTAMACLPLIVVQAVRAEETATATGLNANIRTVGGAVGAAAGASIVTALAGTEGSPTLAGYQAVFLLLGAASLLAAGATLLVPVVRHRQL